MGRCLWLVMSVISPFVSLVSTMKSRKGARSACAVALPMMVHLLLEFLYKLWILFNGFPPNSCFSVLGLVVFCFISKLIKHLMTKCF